MVTPAQSEPEDSDGACACVVFLFLFSFRRGAGGGEGKPKLVLFELVPLVTGGLKKNRLFFFGGGRGGKGKPKGQLVCVCVFFLGGSLEEDTRPPLQREMGAPFFLRLAYFRAWFCWTPRIKQAGHFMGPFFKTGPNEQPNGKRMTRLVLTRIAELCVWSSRVYRSRRASRSARQSQTSSSWPQLKTPRHGYEKSSENSEASQNAGAKLWQFPFCLPAL